jgi:chorismate mutase / prephenate dehydratase
VRENDATFAVLPWPQDGEAAPWWPHLFNQQSEDNMRIVAALPYGVPENRVGTMAERALIVSKTDFAASGEDHSFLALELDSTVSRARIVDVFKAVDLKLLTLNTRPVGGRSLHFIEVDDYVDGKDKRLTEAQEKFNGANARFVALGGYPIPPVFKTFKAETVETKKTGT